jgi:hypothetical protein
VRTVVLPTQLNIRASSGPKSGSAAGPGPVTEAGGPLRRPARSARKRS